MHRQDPTRFTIAASFASTLALLVACGGTVDPLDPSGGGTSSSGGSSAGGSSAGGSSAGGSSAGGGTPQGDGCLDRVASGVILTDVSFFQVVQVDALSGGQEVHPAARRAPLVQDRAAVLHASVEVDAAFESRELGARVSVTTSAGTETFLHARMVSSSSSPSDPATGFLVDLPAAAMAADATYAVSIVECEPAAAGTPSASARFPADGTTDLAAVQTGPLAIHFVPFEIGGFVPDTSQPVLDGFRDAILSIYPVTDVVMTVGDVVPDQYGGQVDMGGLLVDLGVIQEQVDQAPPHVYYYGLVTGAETREEFCDTCPTGTSESGFGDKAAFAIGAAFADEKAESTLLHELGHLHGLLHAPCGGPSLLDPMFPYPDGSTSILGYDFRTETFVPADHNDLMGYCQPRWVSDYHYAKLVDWAQLAQTWSSASANAQAGGADSEGDNLLAGSKRHVHRCFGH